MIDYDVYNEWVNSQVHRPHLDILFRDYLERGKLPWWEGIHKAIRLWIHPEGFVDSDMSLANKEKAGSNYELVQEEVLDQRNYNHAILTTKKAIRVSTLIRYLAPRRGVTIGAQ